MWAEITCKKEIKLKQLISLLAEILQSVSQKYDLK